MKKRIDRRETCIRKQWLHVDESSLSFLKIYNDKFHRVRIIIDSFSNSYSVICSKYVNINKILDLMEFHTL